MSRLLCILKSVFSIKLRSWFCITTFSLPERIFYARRVMSASLVFVAGIISNMVHRKRALPLYAQSPLISSAWFSRHISSCKKQSVFLSTMFIASVPCSRTRLFLRRMSVWYRESWLYLCQSFVIFLYAQLLMDNNIKWISKFLTLSLCTGGFLDLPLYFQTPVIT